MRHNRTFQLFREDIYHSKVDLSRCYSESVQRKSSQDLCTFILSILQNGMFSVSAFIVAVLYIGRFKSATHICIHKLTWRPLFLVSLLVADKMWEDKPVRNSSMPKLFPVLKSAELNLLENTFLMHLKFHLNVSPAEFALFCEILLCREIDQTIQQMVMSSNFVRYLDEEVFYHTTVTAPPGEQNHQSDEPLIEKSSENHINNNNWSNNIDKNIERCIDKNIYKNIDKNIDNRGWLTNYELINKICSQSSIEDIISFEPSYPTHLLSTGETSLNNMCSSLLIRRALRMCNGLLKCTSLAWPDDRNEDSKNSRGTDTDNIWISETDDVGKGVLLESGLKYLPQILKCCKNGSWEGCFIFDRISRLCMIITRYSIGLHLCKSQDNIINLNIVSALCPGCPDIDKTDEYIGCLGNVSGWLLSPEVEVSGPEVAGIMKKLLATIDVLLVRQFTSMGMKVGERSSVIQWLSSSGGVHRFSEWIDLPRYLWVNRIQNRLSQRYDNRKHWNLMTHLRQGLIFILCFLATYHYSRVRALAQDIIKDTARTTLGARNAVIRFMFDILHRTAQQLPIITNNKQDVCEEEVIDDEIESISSTEIEVKKRVIKNVEEDDGDLRNARLSGATYTIGLTSMLRRLWETPDFVQRTVVTMCEILARPVERSNVHNRITSLMKSWLSFRHSLKHRESWNKCILIGVHGSLLTTLEENGDCLHWRFVLYSTCTLVILSINLHQISNESIVNIIENNDENLNNWLKKSIYKNISLRERYINWLIKCIHAKNSTLLLNTLCMHALCRVFKSFLSTKKKMINSKIFWSSSDINEPRWKKMKPPRYSILLNDKSDNKTDIPDLSCIYTHEASDEFKKKLISKELFDTISDVLPLVHHLGAKRELSGPQQAFPEAALEVIAEVIRLPQSFPVRRVPGFIGSVISTHNMLLCQTYYQFLYRAYGYHKDDTNEELCFVTWLMEHLRKLSNTPRVEIECHVAFLEMVAGVVRASRRWLRCHQTCLWRQLHSILCTEIKALDHPRMGDLSSCFRFCCYNINRSELHSIRPFFNFILDYSKDPTLPINIDLTKELYPMASILESGENGETEAKKNGEGSEKSFEQVKRLRIYDAVLIEVGWRCEALIKGCVEAIKDAHPHPYKQMREEISRTFFFLIQTCRERGAPLRIKNYGDDLKDFISRRVTALVPEVNSEEARADRRETGSCRLPCLCATECLICVFLHSLLTHEVKAISDVVVQACPLLFVCVGHPDNSLSSLAYHFLNCFSTSPMRVSLEVSAEEMKKALKIRLEERYIDALASASCDSSYKVRVTAVRLLELVSSCHRMLLKGTSESYRVTQVITDRLTDPQSEVRTSARSSLSNLFMCCSDSECNQWSKKFQDMCGPPPPWKESSQRGESMLAGVLGLSGLVAAFPYSIPIWFPEAVTALAGFGHSQSPETVRKTVQTTLQEFFKSHQDAWHQHHKRLFSDYQLDKLETFKGRPSYFA
eukprot:GHVL01042040.1.p1 GENE.GHVL01042040.1~~GHVL01042040.1.p1  ORF type:complete len:1523 (+),score=288.15 GHVL01042040.1:133-4569(+)